MKTLVFVLFAAAVLGAAPARAEHNSGPETKSTLDLDLKVDRDGFRLGGRLLGDHVRGAWLNGRLTDGGFSVDGRVQGEDRAYNFKLNADVVDALKRAALRWWLLSDL
jgi:hypothetical protein